MKRFLKVTALSLGILVSGVVAYIVLTTTNPAGAIKGKVVSKNPDEIIVEKSDGSTVILPIPYFDVGDQVNILVYKNDFTGITEYRYFTVHEVGVVGE